MNLRIALKATRIAACLAVALSVSTLNASTFEPQVEFHVPELGGGVGLIDQQKERQIGEKVYREVQRQLPVLNNPWLEDQLFATFSHILTQTQLSNPIALIVVNDPQINAFAVPGGLFALNTGLLNSAKNMDEVAGVMAHEIAHVTQRHYSRSQDAFKGQGILALAGVVVGALVASQADGDAGTALMLGTQAALADRQLSYSRNQEREADRIGMQFMYKAGYNPQSMADFFETMHRATSRLSFIPDFWLTHPLTSERMSEARLRANQLPKVNSTLYDENFEIMRLYSMVLSNQANEQQLKSMAENGRKYAPTLALAAFYLNQGQFNDAQQVLNWLQKHQRLHHLQTLMQTEVYLAQNNIAKALNIIESPARIMPENRALNYKYAEVLIRVGQYSNAERILQRFSQTHPRDIQVWRLFQRLADADQNSPLRNINVLRYRAEAEYWSGLEENAIKSLLQAERLTQLHPALAVVVKARLKQMQKERQMRI
ncbi:M48 family metalloprotease [uncultured Acinetobacter sp.]|uniref:M48 family metalloprotease n=1 Tax=uncultured Acinetobacter sp. TaxID=165433 RepID=UPI0026321BAB|nr:M48 family metalloprotease [uncultured Acinetobacter sp.]